MKKAIKILSLILAIIIVVTALPVASFATTPSDTPETSLTVSDIVDSINEVTGRATVSSYKWSRNSYYIEDFDMDSKETLDSIIASIDANANVNSVFGSFLGVGEDEAFVNYGEFPSEGMSNEDYLLKKTKLTVADVNQLTVNGNVYTLFLNACTNPQKDGTNSLHRATNDFITIGELNGKMGTVSPSISFNEDSILDYSNIIITAIVEDGYLQELQISYLLEATLNMRLMDMMNTTGTGTVKTDIVYSDFVYDGVAYIPFGDVNGDGFADDNDNGLFEYGGNLYYIENGEFSFAFTGLYKYDGVWYYISNGLVDYDYTGLVKHTNGIWYYVEDGVLDWSYSGLWKHNGTWYYVQKGQINWKFTGLVQHTNGTWYYVKGAKLNWGYTGLVKHNTGSWFYVQKGQINFDYTGLVKHTNGIWYYIENGKLDWGHSGLWKHNGTWYYVQKGQINWKFTGLVKHTNGTWYYVQGAKLNWNYTGLVKHTNNKWYYVQKGQINFNYTGYVTHNGVKYKVVNGVKV